MMKKIKDKILISSSAKGTIKESAELALELDTGLEISRLPFYKNKDTSENEVIQEVKEALEGFNNRITLHAMFSDINISTQDKQLKEIAEKRCIQSFNTGKAIKADTILYHTGNKGTKHYGSQELFKRNFISFWKEFIKEFERNGITAVIENVYEEIPEYCIKLMEGVNSENFKLALDTGHVNLYTNMKIIDWIKEYNKNLYHMHIHNNYKLNDDHSNLENGTIDYKEVFTKLRQLNLNPSIVLEMFTEEDIRKSLEFIKTNALI